MVPSSSGLGRLVLIQKIAGSTPAGITNLTQYADYGVIFILLFFIILLLVEDEGLFDFVEAC